MRSSTMEYDICVFTSAHCASDTRIFRKEVMTLLNAGYKVLYYTNQCSQDISSGNEQESIFSHNNLTVIYNKGFNIEKRIGRFLRSFGMFFWINKRCKVYHFHDPDLIVCGAFLKILGKKVIYDVHENYIDNISEKPYLSGFVRKVLSSLYKFFENLFCRRYNMIIAATPSIKASYDIRRYRNVNVIYNFPKRQELLSSLDSERSPKEDTFIYVGGLTEIRGITNLVNALEIANSIKSINLVLAGPISPPLYKKELESLAGWKNVKYLGTISRSQMAREFSQAMCGICIFKPLKNHVEAMPNKIFEYMSAGLPILCSHFDLWKELVVLTNTGYVCDPEDVNSIANALVSISNLSKKELQEKGKSGIDLIETKYSWENEEKELLNIYQNMI